MSFKSTFLAAAAAAFTLASAALAGDAIMVKDPYARSSTMMSGSGAAFMVLMNHGTEDDRLVAASSDIAEKVELHTHKEDGDGVMRMMKVEEGFPVPAGGMHTLARGGDHVMFLGLRQPMKHGDTVTVTLTFEKAGDITVDIPVDLERKPMHGMKHKHGQTNTDG